MAVTGDWTLFYDWGCDGSYSKTSMTVNSNGTWTNGEGYDGPWVQIAGMFMFTFNNSETTYAPVTLRVNRLPVSRVLSADRMAAFTCCSRVCRLPLVQNVPAVSRILKAGSR